MGRVKNYVILHLNIMLFSFTSVFSKAASIEYNRNGMNSIILYVFLLLMLLNCFFYALAWQKTIKRFDLNTAYANKSVYLIWSQLWAVIIFKENLSFLNITGILIILTGVLVVQKYE